MTTPKTHPHDDLAVYALDALEPTERDAVDAHLADCAGCRAELATYRETLGRMTVPEEPPNHLWEGISRQLGPTAAAPATAPATSAGDLPVEASPRGGAEVVSLDSRRRPAWLRSGRVLAIAAALVLTLGVGTMAWQLRDRGPDSLEEVAQAAAEDPDSTVVELTADTGDARAARVVITDDQDYVLFDDLPALAEDRTYQLWRTDEGVPASLGVLGDAEAGAAEVTLPPSTTAFAISVEPAGGSTTPTEIVAT